MAAKDVSNALMDHNILGALMYLKQLSSIEIRNWAEPDGDWTLLHRACSTCAEYTGRSLEDMREIFEILLLWIDVNHQITRGNFKSYAPIHHVSNPKLIEYLHQHGANLDIKTASGATAIVLCAVSRSYDAVYALARLGADAVSTGTDTTLPELLVKWGKQDVLMKLFNITQSPIERQPSYSW